MEQERVTSFGLDLIRDHERELREVKERLQQRRIGKEEATRLMKRSKVIQEAVKRWSGSGIRSIGQIQTRERLCEEVWRPALSRFIKRTGIGISVRERKRKGRSGKFKLSSSR